MARETRFKRGQFEYKRGGGLILTGDLTVEGEFIAGAGVELTEPFTFEDAVTMEDNLAVTGNVAVTGTLDVTAAATFTAGAQSAAVAVTATADGLTTGLIAAGTRFVSVTSANADHIVHLPAAVVGNVIEMWVGANGFELRSAAASNATINNVDADGTNELAIPATTFVRATCVATGTWIVDAWDELGADIAALVPDAA